MRAPSKRSADEAAAEDAALVEQLKQIVKKARTERPPSKEPDQTPAQGHRYQTRSKTKSNESQAGKKRSQDVVMKGVEHHQRIEGNLMFPCRKLKGLTV